MNCLPKINPKSFFLRCRIDKLLMCTLDEVIIVKRQAMIKTTRHFMIYRNIADLLENKFVGCFDEIPTILNSPAQQLLRCVRTLLTMTREKIEKKIQGRFTIIRFTHLPQSVCFHYRLSNFLEFSDWTSTFASFWWVVRHWAVQIA